MLTLTTTQKVFMNKVFFYKSPIGTLKITAKIKSSEGVVKRIEFYSSSVVEATTRVKPNSFESKVLNELDMYFHKSLGSFSFKFEIEGTPFQKSVWRALKNVKFSKTVSYKDIANKIKKPKAVRAVGTACGKNPIPIMIPCHRIVGSNGDLIGYDGGLWRKKWLLNHEKPAT